MAKKIASLLLFLCLVPLVAFAQAAATTVPPASEPAWLQVVLTQAWPILVMVVVLPGAAWLLATGLPKIDGILAAHRDDKQASAAGKTFFAALIPINHLLEQFIAAGLADLKANPTKTPLQAAQALAADAKAVLGKDGAETLQSEVGIGADALTTYVTHALTTKITDAQATAAAAAGAKVDTAVAKMPLAAIATEMGKGPA